MNTKTIFIALIFAAASMPGFASDQSSNANSSANPAAASADYGAGDIAAEIFLRPAGFIATVIGAGLYLSFLPPVAINSIYPPHEPIKDWADIIVINPAKFTFTRPIGDYTYPQTEKRHY